jgi:hypothetical protein
MNGKLEVENNSQKLSINNVIFPRLALKDPGNGSAFLFPRGPGVVSEDPWHKDFKYHGTYPDGWTTMPFMAAWNDSVRTGLYFGVHDPLAGMKRVHAETRPDSNSLEISFESPAENSMTPGNDFKMNGESALKILRGDWFDAAMIYGNWVRSKAPWYLHLSDEGRSDTPLWMREVPVWVNASGASKDVVPAVKAFREYMGVPVAVHWYNWHQVPFDNDYPHYFPVKEGFAEGIHELQEAGIYVMPYINGRLWDTRDSAASDFQFSKIAKPAATKDEQGQPYTESYNSKEADGSPVKLAVMCPATSLWQQTVRGICFELFNRYKVDAVYIDQVAAAAPKTCFDASHDHPQGGGHWWVDGYGKMLKPIQDSISTGQVLTTECNAEPFARWFDGYLTWHWQFDGQVPAFPAIYSGAIQLFGRSFGKGATRDLALRMKSGQQLVFGEQLGWMDPRIIEEKANAEFLRQAVQLRWLLRRFFYAGEMFRPPLLEGNIPEVRADWQWTDNWWVTTNAVLTGAWKIKHENKLALIFVNVSDEPLSADFSFNGDLYDFDDGAVTVTTYTGDRAEESFQTRTPFRRKLSFKPASGWVWIIEEAK